MSRSHWRRYRASPALLAAAAAAALAVGTAAPAVASATSSKPRISFYFYKTNRINSTTRPVIKYTSAHLPSGTKLELQRQFGTAHVWKDVKALAGHSGKTSIPTVQMGRYPYRIKAYRHGKTVVLSSNGILYSYSRIPLTNICNDNNNNDNVYMEDADGCTTQTVQVGGTVFVYLIDDNPPAPPNYDQDIHFGASTTCRTISLQFSLDNNANSGDTAMLQLVQTTADSQSASVGTGQIGSAYFTLAGGPWDLDLSDSNGDAEYVNGYASCWTPGGLR